MFFIVYRIGEVLGVIFIVVFFEIIIFKVVVFSFWY